MSIRRSLQRPVRSPTDAAGLTPPDGGRTGPANQLSAGGRLGRRPLLRAAPALALPALAPLLGGAAAAQDTRFMRIGTGTTGGTYFPIGGIIASAISGPPGAPPCELGGSCGVPGLIAVAQASTGSVENIRNLQDGNIELGLCQSDVGFFAYSGTGVFSELGPIASLRGIASLYVEQIHVVVAADSPIHGVEDFVGRRIVLGEEGSGTLVASRLILEAYEIAESDIEPLFLDPESAAEGIHRGEVDAMVFVGGAPILAIDDLARRSDIRLVPVTGDGALTLMREQPFFAESQVPDEVYAGVAGVETVGVSALLLTTDAQDTETVYGITRALWHPTTAALLATGHPRGAEIVVANALNAMALPPHPGAVRYYSEIDLFNATEPL